MPASELLTLEAIGLRKLALNPTTAAFTETGRATGLVAAHTLAASAGSFALTGYRLNVTRALSTGSFAVSGQAVALKVSRQLPAAQASFVYSPKPVVLLRWRTIILAQATMALTGQAMTPRVARKIAPAYGTFARTDQTFRLLWGRALAAGIGSFALSRKTAAITAQRKSSLVNANYSLSGLDVLFSKTSIPPRNDYTLGLAQAAYLTTWNDTLIVYTQLADTGSEIIIGRTRLIAREARTLAIQPEIRIYTI